MAKVEIPCTSGKQLLLVTQWYAPEQIGTAFYATDMAQWFAVQGYHTRVLTNRPTYPLGSSYPDYVEGARDKEMLDSVMVERLSAAAPMNDTVRSRLRFDVSFFFRGLLALMTGRVKRAEAVISFSPSVLAVLLGSISTTRSGRHLAIVHDLSAGLAGELGMFSKANIIFRRAEKFALNRADDIVVLSEQMKKAVLRLGVKTTVHVLPIWVDTDLLIPQPREREQPPTVLYSGNLGRKQGLEQLLDAAEILMREMPGARLAIRGSGSQEGMLRDIAIEKGLTNVDFGSLVQREKLSIALSQADVHVIPQDPSTADYSVPSKVYNAMAVGRPFVCTALPGTALATICQGSRAGICVSPGNPDALAHALCQLLTNETARKELGSNGRNFVEKNVGRSKIMAEYRRLLWRGSVEASS